MDGADGVDSEALIGGATAADGADIAGAGFDDEDDGWTVDGPTSIGLEGADPLGMGVDDLLTDDAGTSVISVFGALDFDASFWRLSCSTKSAKGSSSIVHKIKREIVVNNDKATTCKVLS